MPFTFKANKIVTGVLAALVFCAVVACSNDTDAPSNGESVTPESEPTVSIEDITIAPKDPGANFSIDDSAYVTWDVENSGLYVSFVVTMTNVSETDAVHYQRVDIQWLDENGEPIESRETVRSMGWVPPGDQFVFSDSIPIEAEPSSFEIVFFGADDDQLRLPEWVEFDSIDDRGSVDVVGVEQTSDEGAGLLRLDIDIESSLPWDSTTIHIVALWRDRDGTLIGGSESQQNLANIGPGDQTVEFIEGFEKIPEEADIEESEFHAQLFGPVRLDLTVSDSA